mmetsp:Transcript_2296/g.3950  ORF Transcript_2296/g.3950 Transcript_2296/m.3950 type:complete len:223 (+) Transcript_2296:103-771(+)
MAISRVPQQLSNSSSCTPADPVGACLRLALAAELHPLVPPVSCTTRRTQAVGVLALVSQATCLSSGGCLAAQLTVLVLGQAYPVDPGIITDNLVHRIHHDHLVPLVHSILCNPVRVENTQASKLLPNTLLSQVSQVSWHLLLVDALVLWLAVHNAFGDQLLAATALHANPVHAEALLGFVAHPVGLVRPGWLCASVNGRQLTVLPSPKSGKESHHVRLLLGP